MKQRVQKITATIGILSVILIDAGFIIEAIRLNTVGPALLVIGLILLFNAAVAAYIAAYPGWEY